MSLIAASLLPVNKALAAPKADPSTGIVSVARKQLKMKGLPKTKDRFTPLQTYANQAIKCIPLHIHCMTLSHFRQEKGRQIIRRP